MSNISHPDKIIFFDGICVFCNYWVNFLLKNDKKQQFKYASLQSDNSQQILSQYNIHFEEFKTMVYIKYGKVFTYDDAAIEIMKDLGYLFSWIRIAYVFPKKFRKFIYKVIARNRYKWFGKMEQCALPNLKDRERFIS